MKGKKIEILTIIFTLQAPNVFATISYLVVNHWTKQLYWAETDHSPGWIGWEAIPDGIYDIKEQEFLEMGYTMTTNPFLIEEIFLLVFVLSFVVFWRLKKKKSRKTMNAQQINKS